MQYTIVIEKAQNNYSAYVRDLPGCITTGKTLQEVETNMREAITFHLRDMREDGLPIPEATTKAVLVEVAKAGLTGGFGRSMGIDSPEPDCSRRAASG